MKDEELFSLVLDVGRRSLNLYHSTTRQVHIFTTYGSPLQRTATPSQESAAGSAVFWVEAFIGGNVLGTMRTVTRGTSAVATV